MHFLTKGILASIRKISTGIEKHRNNEIDATIDITPKPCYSVASEVMVIVTTKQNKSISGGMMQ